MNGGINFLIKGSKLQCVNVQIVLSSHVLDFMAESSAFSSLFRPVWNMGVKWFGNRESVWTQSWNWFNFLRVKESLWCSSQARMSAHVQGCPITNLIYTQVVRRAIGFKDCLLCVEGPLAWLLFRNTWSFEYLG